MSEDGADPTPYDPEADSLEEQVEEAKSLLKEARELNSYFEDGTGQVELGVLLQTISSLLQKLIGKGEQIASELVRIRAELEDKDLAVAKVESETTAHLAEAEAELETLRKLVEVQKSKDT